MYTTDAKIVAKARVKIKRADISLKDTQMLQAPMIPTASADPKVAILKNHSILSDLFIVSHFDYTITSYVSIVVNGLQRTERLAKRLARRVH
jgi:hypothetical protein